MTQHIGMDTPAAALSRRQVMMGAAGLSFAVVLDGPLARAATLASERTGRAISPWVSIAADGTITGRRLVKSSGSKEWDDAVLRAIDRTGELPRDIDGRVPSPILIEFRPRDL